MRRRTRWSKLFAATWLSAMLAVSMAQSHPAAGIAVDRAGNVYFSHTGASNYKLGVDGKLVRIEGEPWHFLELDPKGSFLHQRWPAFHEEIRPGVIGVADSEIQAVGKEPTVLLGSSFPFALGQDGALYYPDVLPDGYVHLMRLAPGGAPTDFAKLPAAIEIGFEGNPIRRCGFMGWPPRGMGISITPRKKQSAASMRRGTSPPSRKRSKSQATPIPKDGGAA